MQYFFNPNLETSSKHFSLEADESKHILKVLRRQIGDVLLITNGKGEVFHAKIMGVKGKKCIGDILRSEKSLPKNYRLHLAVAPTKMNDRFEWFLEKATEIGIDEITPIICERSERKTVKAERLEKVLQAAMKQSLQTYLPLLNAPMTLEAFLQRPEQGICLIAHCEEDRKTDMLQELVPKSEVTVLIGPEGDFSPREIAQALHKGFRPVSLGNNRLRTETAAIVACTVVAMANNKT
ncbi:MAG: 16S rRNA (uracil(1498)-N(3))-methyltransferase [Flavobacteriaceae bacterium]